MIRVHHPFVASLLLLVGAVWLCPANASSGAQRANVLLITVDTLRADHLHCYGFPFQTSPSIDALAARSIVFERAIAASGYTGPAHAAILASRYPRHHSMGYSNGQHKLTSVRTLAQEFHAAGYATAAFVSNPVVAHASGFDQGFDTYDDDLTQAELNRPGVFERPAERTTGAALAWLWNTNGGPFFLWVHYEDPHGPYAPPLPYRDQFHFPSVGQPELKVLPDESGLGGIPHYQALEGLHRPAEYESRYAGEIAYADHWIGELLTQAQARSGGRPLVILLTADHGESFGEENFYCAHGQSTAPELSHVPVILHLPGRAAARRRELVSQVDVMPTLLAAAGLPVPHDLDGLPLTRYLGRKSALRDRTVFCDIGYELSAYRGNKFLRLSLAPERSGDLAMAYQTGRARAATPGDLRAEATFAWSRGPTWTPSPADKRLEHDARRYLSTKAGFSQNPTP